MWFICPSLEEWFENSPICSRHQCKESFQITPQDLKLYFFCLENKPMSIKSTRFIKCELLWNYSSNFPLKRLSLKQSRFQVQLPEGATEMTKPKAQWDQWWTCFLYGSVIDCHENVAGHVFWQTEILLLNAVSFPTEVNGLAAVLKAKSWPIPLCTPKQNSMITVVAIRGQTWGTNLSNCHLDLLQ